MTRIRRGGYVARYMLGIRDKCVISQKKKRKKEKEKKRAQGKGRK